MGSLSENETSRGAPARPNGRSGAVAGLVGPVAMPGPLAIWGPVAGLAAVSQYLVLAVISFLFYPLPFGPGGSWLSDLGNMVLNPGGAWFYRAAGILGGAGLCLFFLSIRRADPRPGPWRIHLSLARIFGVTPAAFTGIAALRGGRLPRWRAA